MEEKGRGKEEGAAGVQHQEKFLADQGSLEPI